MLLLRNKSNDRTIRSQAYLQPASAGEVANRSVTRGRRGAKLPLRPAWKNMSGIVENYWT